MNDDPKNLSHMLNDQSRPFYVTPENIAAAHPLKTGRFDISNAAMILVSERHAKGDLVDLVNAILQSRDIEHRENLTLRRLLAFMFAGGPSKLYCDDGELQFNDPQYQIDFVRDPADKIEATIKRWNLKRYNDQLAEKLANELKELPHGTHHL